MNALNLSAPSFEFKGLFAAKARNCYFIHLSDLNPIYVAGGYVNFPGSPPLQLLTPIDYRQQLPTFYKPCKHCYAGPQCCCM